MNKYGKCILRIFGLLVLLVAIYNLATLRWSNIDMTNQRLLIEYPVEIIGNITISMIGYLLLTMI